MRRSAVGDYLGLVAQGERLIVPSHRGMSVADRLDVYREQFWLRHVPSLEEDYPTLCWALGGPMRFGELAMEYLSMSPPRTWDMQKLGQGLPSHVESHAPWKCDPLFVDAARLDWAFMEAFDAPDAPPFDARLLAATAEDALPLATIIFHPSVRGLTLDHPVHELRRAVKRSVSPTRPGPLRTHLVVWRDVNCSLQAEEVEREALVLLVALADGSPLGSACDALVDACGADLASKLGPRVTSWFKQWTSRGWLSAVRLPP
jgi:hypothetical protein